MSPFFSKRFRCMINCHPDQETFIDPATTKIIEDYPDPSTGDPITVLTSTIVLNAPSLCEFYKSCKNVYFVKELGSMSSPEGFIGSMAGKGVSNGHYLMNFTFSQKDGIPVTNYPCNKVYDTKNEAGDVIDPSNYVIFQNQGTYT
jgi:hypothetical protein